MPDQRLVTRLRAAGCVFAEEEAELLADASEEMIARRIAGEPLETVLGWAFFAGIRVICAPGVFVPRTRSELLVRLAVRAIATDEVDAAGAAERAGVIDDGLRPSERPRVLDLGCGTGALGAAVAARVPGAEVWAVDVDPAAVACARLNLPPGRVLQGDLYEPLLDRGRSAGAGRAPTQPRARGASRSGAAPAEWPLRFDVIIANAPYVPTEEIALMPSEARDHEHRVALDGGADGLDVQRRVIEQAPGWLAERGVLLVESSRRQAPVTAALMEQAGLTTRIHTDDDIAATVVSGRN